MRRLLFSFKNSYPKMSSFTENVVESPMVKHLRTKLTDFFEVFFIYNLFISIFF